MMIVSDNKDKPGIMTIIVIGPDNPSFQVENIGRHTKSRKPWVEDKGTRAHETSERELCKCDWYELARHECI